VDAPGDPPGAFASRTGASRKAETQGTRKVREPP
jgi:hypothetical protein